MKLNIGENLSFEEEGISGVVTHIDHVDGEPVACVVAMPDGTFAALDLTLLKQETLH